MEEVLHSSQSDEFETHAQINNRATLHMARVEYRPHMPDLLKGFYDLTERAVPENDSATVLKGLFPHTYGQPRIIFKSRSGTGDINPFIGRVLRIGVVFSGGPASGGHNVLTGLLDFVMRHNADSKLFGFLGGPGGIVSNKYKEITESEIAHYRNLGGFHFLGSGRTKIETDEQLKASIETVSNLQLDGLIVIGGDDSNTNAGILAEYFATNNCSTCVIGVPKTIDGDMRNEDIEASFGFDTACRVYAASAANLCFDAISALKSYHFVRVMGRDASHITLEVALQVHPNMAFISEEIGHSKAGLTDIVDRITNLVVERAKVKKDYGVILIPEGLVGFAEDLRILIAELNEIMAHKEGGISIAEFDTSLLSPPSKILFEELPDFILAQMMAERDPHGNVQVAAIETERLLASMVKARLEKLAATKQYTGKFSVACHYLGYEGRCALPSKFDCDYCYTLGATAGALIELKKSGYVASVKNLASPCKDWMVGASPLVGMMNIERRKGKDKPVIKKKLVDLDDAPFHALAKMRDSWMLNDDYRMPGPIQHSGSNEDERNFTLLLESEARSKLACKKNGNSSGAVKHAH